MDALQTRVEDLANEAELKKQVETILDLAKKKGATDAEVGLSVSQGLSLTVRLQELENIEFNRDKGIGITVYKGHKKGSASTNDLSLEAIEHTLDAALNLAEYTEEDPFSGLADKESMAQEIIDCDLYHPWSISIDDAKAMAFECEKYALDEDSRISNSEGASIGSYQAFRVYGNTHGFIGGYPSTRHMLSCVVIAEDAHGMQRDYEYSSTRNPDDLWTAKLVGQSAAARTMQRLSSERIPTTKMPVIFKNHIASGLFGHFCSGISGGKLYRKSTFLLDSKGQEIFSPIVQLSEKPHLKQGMGSAPFDGDGVLTKSRDLVKDGVVQGYILSAYSARKLKMQNTGNAGGVHNLMVEPSQTSFDDLISGQDKALLVTELMGRGINLVTGDYSRGAAGYLIENGKITKPVHEITIASNLKDMFKGIETIANDVDKRGNIQTGSVLINNMTIAGS